MSLLSYSDARPWAKAIKTKVTRHEMPPWGANPALSLLMRRAPSSTLFPYTTLFRSASAVATSVAVPSSANVMRVSKNRTRIAGVRRSEEHTSELQSRLHLVCRLLLEKKNVALVVLGCAPVGEGHQDQGDQARDAAMGRQPGFVSADAARPQLYTLSLHDALPICLGSRHQRCRPIVRECNARVEESYSHCRRA